MSAYTDQLLAIAGGPTFWYKLDEVSGTTFATSDINGTNQHLTKNVLGTATMGLASLLPGDPTGRSVAQDKDTFLADRAHNGIWDLGQPRHSTHCWLRLDKLKGESDSGVIVNKVGAYQLALSATAIQAGITGQDPDKLASPRDTLAPDNLIYLAQIYDGDAGTWRIMVNGMTIIQRTVPAGVTHPTGSGRLQVGGLDTFGSQGLSGAMQHLCIHTNYALTDAQVQSLYVAGQADAGELAGQALNVMPFSRLVSGTNPSRISLRLTNDSDTTMYVTRGDTANRRAGLRLAPHGGERVIKLYTGPVSVIGAQLLGVKRLIVEEI